MKVFLFPGQGSQFKGMGKNLFDDFKAIVAEADEILGYSIRELCVSDPERKLNNTQFTQPALYVVNALTYYKAVDCLGRKPDYVAGHSLGEFNALLAADAFTFEVGLKLVKKRGELMAREKGGAMAAILNFNGEEVEAVLQENNLSEIDVANYNTPSQIVISGLKRDIDQAQVVFKQRNVQCIPLNTSGAFHSHYMQSAGETFGDFLGDFEFSSLKVPVIANVTARPYKDSEIVKTLSKQITCSVKWCESILYLAGLGNMEFEEIGHSHILSNMVQSILKESKAGAISRLKPIDNCQRNEVSSAEGGEDILKTLGEKRSELSPDDQSLMAVKKIEKWNKSYPVGTFVKSQVISDGNLKTRTKAVLLFGHQAAIYLEGYKGYFDLDEIVAFE